jgi:hypothetical protein
VRSTRALPLRWPSCHGALRHRPVLSQRMILRTGELVDAEFPVWVW